MRRNKTNDEFIKELRTVNPNITVLGTYVSSQTPIQVSCNICGHVWKPTPNNLQQGKGCPKCNYKLRCLKQRKSDVEFKIQMKEINPNIKILGTYINRKTPIQVFCNTCGNVWNPIPDNLLQGYGCPVCHGNKKTHDEFIKELYAVNPNINVLGTYVNSKTPIQVSCRVCGNVWMPTPNNLLRGKGCRVCGYKLAGSKHRISGSKYRKSDTEFKNQMKKIHSNINVLGTYVDSRTSIQISCNVCEHIWESTPNNLLQGHGCSVCSRKSAGRHRKSDAEFKAQMKEIHPNIKVLETYVGSKTPIQISCSVCGNTSKLLPSNLLRGSGCPVCGNKSTGLKQRKSDAEFKAQMKEINPAIEILGTYTISTEPIACKCNICSHEWKGVPYEMLRGRGCPKCSKIGTSFVEQAILLVLKELCPCEVIGRDRALIGMELDVLIPAMRVAIEYGAWYWHKDKINRDQEKARLCKDKGILLIQIFEGYTGSENDTDCVWYYHEDIGRNLYVIKELIIRVCEKIGISFTLNDEEFDKILCEARRNSTKDTTESFNKMLKEMGSKVRLLGNYYNMHIKILAECQECGYRWKAAPTSLKYNGGKCPNCIRTVNVAACMKKVMCIELGTVYNSIRRASEVTNASYTGISKCCLGKANTAGGYHWRFYEKANT